MFGFASGMITKQIKKKIIFQNYEIFLIYQQVLGICRKYQLFSAFIYITTQALKDYSLPITELIPILNNFCDNCNHVKKLLQPLSNIETHTLIEHDDNMDNSDQNVINNLYNDECQNCMKTRELGDILLVYISGCLVGKMFPSGDLSEVEGDRVKKEVNIYPINVYTCLLSTDMYIFFF